MINAGPKFRPPGRKADYQWRKVALLLREGGYFDHDYWSRKRLSVKTYREAKEYVIRHRRLMDGVRATGRLTIENLPHYRHKALLERSLVEYQDIWKALAGQ